MSGVPPMPRALPGFEGIQRYWDRTRDCYGAKILPGEYYVTCADELITTVLGSCISACVWDPFAGIGGMNHFMLPHDSSGEGRWSVEESVRASTRYGAFAMERLINDVLKHGGARSGLRAKVFGGGRVLHHMTDIGMRNIEFVRRYLADEGIPLAAEDLGDLFPRKVVFVPKTGRAFVKKLRTLHNDTLLARETRYQHDVDRTPVQGTVELF